MLGVKLVNGRPTKAVIEVDNREEGAVQVAFVAGALMSPQPLPAGAPAWQAILRNLTAVPYQLRVGPGESKAVPFVFALDMQPQDVRLQLVAVVSNEKGDIFTVQAHDGEAAIVEPPTSFFDPQM